MAPGAKKVIRYVALATVIAATTAGVLAWRVYPKEVAAWWDRVTESPPPPYTTAEREDMLVQFFGGPDAVDALRATTTARAYRWHDQREHTPIGLAVFLSPDQVDRFVGLITDQSVYILVPPGRDAHLYATADFATLEGINIELDTAGGTRTVTLWYPDVGRYMFIDSKCCMRFKPDHMLPLLRELFPEVTSWDW